MSSSRLPTPDIMGAVLAAKPDEPELILLKDIKRDGGTQMRAGLDQPTVKEYADAMVSFGPRALPPLIVFYDGSNYWLADGFHRYAALEQVVGANGPVWCDVRAGTQRDAMLHAAGANASHGLRRTNADKQRAVRALLEDPEWSQWSDGEIARKCAVSQPFVSSLRPKPAAPTHNGYESPAPVVRKGADGRTINTANIGKAKEAQPYAQVYELESAIRAFSNITAHELREAARKGDGYMFWSRIRDAVDSKSLRWRKADLTQALNNVAAQMEAKANGTNSPNLGTGIAPSSNTVHWGSLREIEAFIREWQDRGQCDVFGRGVANQAKFEEKLIAEIVAEGTQRNIAVNRGTAFTALGNVRNAIVSENARAARQAQREAEAPAPATPDKPMVEWTEAEWEEAEAKAKGIDPEQAAKNAERRDAAIDLLETYRQVLRTEKQYSELTGDFMGTVPVSEGLRKMIKGLESLIEALQ